MSIQAIYGLAAWAVLAGVAICLVIRGGKWPLAAGGAVLALLPVVNGESLAMVLHGAFALPSFTLLQLATRRLALPGQPLPDARPAAAILLALALIFYPLALGAGNVDPYGFGYQPQGLLVALLLAGIVLAWHNRGQWLLILGLDLLAYAAGLYGNLWDALFDPVMVVVATASLAAGVSRRSPG